MHPAVVPSPAEIGGMFGYVAMNPHLFISSSTVMTTSLLLIAALVAPLRRYGAVDRPLGIFGPALFMVLVYFGLGSMALAVQILVRFHGALPLETEIQFVSGLGHLLAAAAGLVVLAPVVRRLSLRRVVEANGIALVYWTLQVLIVRPPWFEFQGQGGEVLAVVLSALGVGLAATAAWHWRLTAR